MCVYIPTYTYMCRLGHSLIMIAFLDLYLSLNLELTDQLDGLANKSQRTTHLGPQLWGYKHIAMPGFFVALRI